MALHDIPVTLSSDAHKPDNLLSGFKEMVPVLKENGIDQLHQYQKGVFRPDNFDEAGLHCKS
jgi:histidinol-phosphatase (PHP family)